MRSRDKRQNIKSREIIADWHLAMDPETFGTSSTSDVVCRTFRHQVGGHKCVLQLSENLICKPCEEPERIFYNNVPEVLKPYVPCYRGEVDVRCITRGNNTTFCAAVPADILNSHSSNLENKYLNRETSPDDSDDDWSKSRLTHHIKCGSLWNNKEFEKFLVLDNLIADYGKPCALDIKIGQFYHGQCDDVQKRLVLERKNNNSTSRTLGFRLCGMQVCNRENGKITKYNKHYGMALTENEVIGALRIFFEGCAKSDLQDLATNLRNIHSAIISQSDYVFLTASLFFYYDKKVDTIEQTHDSTARLNSCPHVRLIDMEKAVPAQECSLLPQHVKDNIRFGMTNLTAVIENFDT